MKLGASPTLLALNLIDGCNVLVSDQPLRIKNRKAVALLAYLAWIAPRAESRERLAGLLWSESDEEAARASLRQTLRHLRRDVERVEFEGIHGNRNELWLEQNSIRTDIGQVISELEANSVADALMNNKRATDSILIGFEDIDPAFGNWLRVQRQVAQDELTTKLGELLDRNRNLDSVLGRNAAIALSNLDPTNETACRHLMACHAAEGDIAASLRIYNQLWQILEDDFDMEPSDETLALVSRIKSGAFAEEFGDERMNAVPATVDKGLSANHRIVVCFDVFDMQNVMPDLTYIIQGVRADLLARLVRFREWSVCEVDDVRDTQDRAHLLRQPIDTYDVKATAIQESEKIRLVLTLKDRASGHFIWSDWFYLEPETWPEIQTTVVRRLAIAMNVHLSAERLTNVATQTNLKPQLFDRWLLGQEQSFEWRPENEKRAEKIFKEIIEDAPSFAPAYSSLVQIMNSRHLIFPGIFRSQSNEHETLSLAKTAVMIDPLDSRSQLCLAWANAMNSYFSQAELNFRLACDLNENDPWSLVSASLGFAFCNQIAQAEKLADQALDLGLGASRLHWGYQTCVRFLAGDYKRAIYAADLAKDMMLGLPAWKAASLFHLGEKEAAKAEGKRFLHLIRDNWEGDIPPADENISRWFLHLYPIRENRQWEHLRSGLVGAGIPVPENDEFKFRRQ